MTVEVVLAAADAAVREAQRRSRGEEPDRRFDVPLAMLRDLHDELAAEPTRPRPERQAPPVGSRWCATHQRYDLCERDEDDL